jgi:hypothetical protein
MQSNQGVYALLLGSGVPRPAGIPTGWEIVEDLIRKVAALRNEDCGSQPAVWYENTFEEPLEYGKLLGMVAKLPAERARLLRNYFEPADAERDSGLKQPTKAHTAIAALVAAGYIRVIVTTNFDRLTEKALENAGIVPTVISTSDSIEGAPPLAHTDCCVLKIHGDYLDSRIKNTTQELETYDPSLNTLLDRIFDEFGLVVCGWSAEWDTALRAALERCKSRRFSTYWTSLSEPTGATKKLLALRTAELLVIQSADSFFDTLREKVEAVDKLARPHPLSGKVTVEILKKYLPDTKYRIELHDLVRSETEKLYAALSLTNFPVQGNQASDEEMSRRIDRYESLSEVLLQIMVSGCFWGEPSQVSNWVQTLERVANPEPVGSGFTHLINLRYYPALLLLYAGGIASITAEKYVNLAALFYQIDLTEFGERLPLLKRVNALKILDEPVAQRALHMERRKTPLSQYLFGKMRVYFKDLVPAESRYETHFDRFEYMLAMAYVDIKESGEWAPFG